MASITALVIDVQLRVNEEPTPVWRIRLICWLARLLRVRLDGEIHTRVLP